MTVFAACLAVVIVLILFYPFFFGPGSRLEYGSTTNSVEVLRTLKREAIETFLIEEDAFNQGQLSPQAWLGRQKFLMGRFIDASRRLDYISSRDLRRRDA